MPKPSIFETHPEGNQIWKKLVNELINYTEAAKVLGCSVANISQIMKRYRAATQQETVIQKKKSKKQKKVELQETKEIIKQSRKLILEMEEEESLDMISVVTWRTIQTGLTKLSQENLDINEYLKVARELRQLLQFHFKNTVPDIPTEAVKIDPDSEKAILEKMEDICFECPFYKEAIKRADDKQEEARILFTKS